VPSCMRILTILLLLTSCISKPPLPAKVSFILESGDLTIRLVSLGPDELKKRHGSNSDRIRNPFVDYPAQFLKKRIVVFEAEISTLESEVLFQLDEILLEIGRVRDSATSPELLMNYWKGYASQEEEVLMQALMRKTMMSREFIVSPDKPVKGYLVFAHSFPREGGDAVISFSVSTPAGDEGVLEQAMEFTEAGIREEGSDEKSIFSEDS